MAEVHITEFTDPGCPWAYSAEPARRRLNWLYGSEIDWSLQTRAKSAANRQTKLPEQGPI